MVAGYADVAIEFANGFATFDILGGFCIGLKTGLTIVDLSRRRRYGTEQDVVSAECGMRIADST